MSNHSNGETTEHHSFSTTSVLGSRVLSMDYIVAQYVEHAVETLRQ
jgi:hypothetical protein